VLNNFGLTTSISSLKTRFSDLVNPEKEKGEN